MASISLCITTRGPAPRVRALLTLLRPAVDEVVLAVDGAGDLDTLDACADLADVRLVYEFVPPPARLIGWIHHQCSGDWILRLDDDEVPGRALLEALPAIAAERRATSVAIPRRWVHGSAGRYVTNHPWTPDHQLRLVRNVPGIWRFDGSLHSVAEVLGERRYAELPIYHLEFLLTPLERRREKRLRNEALRPGYMTEDLPVNAMYVPEDVVEIATEPVPDPDARLVERVLEGDASAPGPSRGAPVRHATAFEIERFNASRSVPATAYHAELRFARPRHELPAATICHVEMEVTNTGDERWPWGPDARPPIRLSYHWRSGAGEVVVAEGLRTPLPESAEPGATVHVPVAVQTPDAPGDYVLEVDLVHEEVRWFEQAASMPVRVRPPHEARPVEPPLSQREPRPPEPGAPPPVLYVTRAFPVLSQTFVLREILWLEQAGLPVLVDSLDRPESEPTHPELAQLEAPVRYLDSPPPLLTREGLRLHAPLLARRPLRWATAALRARRAGRWRRFLQAAMTAERARRHGVRHLHAHFVYFEAEVTRDAARMAGLTFTVTAHANDVFHHVNAPLVAERVRGAAAVVTATRYNVAHLQGVLPRTRVHPVPYGVEHAPAARAPDDGPLLFVSRLVAKKGVDVLIDALALLRDRLPALRTVLIGDGPLWDEVVARVIDRRVADRVRLLGAQPSDRVAAALQECALLALPCRIAPDGDRDGLPNVLLEAMARAVPVVTTDVIGIPELVRDRETGLLVPPDDAEALAEAIEQLVTERELARRLGEQGRAYVREAHDPTRIAAMMERLFATSGRSIEPAR